MRKKELLTSSCLLKLASGIDLQSVDSSCPFIWRNFLQVFGRICKSFTQFYCSDTKVIKTLNKTVTDTKKQEWCSSLFVESFARKSLLEFQFRYQHVKSPVKKTRKDYYSSWCELLRGGSKRRSLFKEKRMVIAVHHEKYDFLLEIFDQNRCMRFTWLLRGFGWKVLEKKSKLIIIFFVVVTNHDDISWSDTCIVGLERNKPSVLNWMSSQNENHTWKGWSSWIWLMGLLFITSLRCPIIVNTRAVTFSSKREWVHQSSQFESWKCDDGPPEGERQDVKTWEKDKKCFLTSYSCQFVMAINSHHKMMRC